MSGSEEDIWPVTIEGSLQRGIPGESYMPRDGCEAYWFRQKWCVKCQHEKVFFERIKDGLETEGYEGCPILVNPFDERIDIWEFGEDEKPFCRLFVSVDEK